MESVSPIVSVVALCISLLTAWFTILRRGSVQSTHPSFVALIYEFSGKEVPQAKVFLRALLFSTGKRGWVIESLFLRVREGSRCEEFSFWGHGDKELVRGSGMFVSESGIVTNHHFTPVHTDALFRFSCGTYSLDLVAKLVGKKQLITLWTIALDVPSGVFDTTIARENAIFFNWSPEKREYVVSTEKRSGSVYALFDPQN